MTFPFLQSQLRICNALCLAFELDAIAKTIYAIYDDTQNYIYIYIQGFGWVGGCLRGYLSKLVELNMTNIANRKVAGN